LFTTWPMRGIRSKCSRHAGVIGTQRPSSSLGHVILPVSRAIWRLTWIRFLSKWSSGRR